MKCNTQTNVNFHHDGGTNGYSIRSLHAFMMTTTKNIHPKVRMSVFIFQCSLKCMCACVYVLCLAVCMWVLVFVSVKKRRKNTCRWGGGRECQNSYSCQWKSWSNSDTTHKPKSFQWRGTSSMIVTTVNILCID